MPKIYRYTVRDGNRIRWLLEIWDSGEFEVHGEYKDVVWTYRVTNETQSVTYVYDVCTGKGDNVPGPTQIMQDLMSHLNHVVLTFVRDAREVTEDTAYLVSVMPEVCSNYGITKGA